MPRDLIRLLLLLILALCLLLFAGGAAGEISYRFAGLLVLLLVAVLMSWLIARHEDLLAEARRDALRLGRAREQARARAAAPLRSKLVQGFAEPLMLVDPSRRVVEANLAARELFGDGVLGADLALYLRQPGALEVVQAAIRGGEAREGSFSTTTPVERHYVIRATLVANAAPETGGEADDTPTAPPFFVVVALHDITELKFTERMRVDFVANASHELRTPLSSLIGFIETLSGPAKDDAAARERFLGIMRTEGDRMVRLIDDLLSLSRIEMEKHLSPKGEVNIAELIDSVAKSLEPKLAEDGRELIRRVPADLPLARGDADQLVQVLQNLLSNALKYGRAGTPIQIEAEAKDHLRISVIDQGDGIPEAHLPRLTERFYRVDSARSRRLGGTGLGLAIVKHIVERHRGELTIRSREGQGTTVSFTLPRASAP